MINAKANKIRASTIKARPKTDKLRSNTNNTHPGTVKTCAKTDKTSANDNERLKTEAKAGPTAPPIPSLLSPHPRSPRLLDTPSVKDLFFCLINACYFCDIFAQVSFNVTVRLNTGAPGSEYLESTQK